MTLRPILILAVLVHTSLAALCPFQDTTPCSQCSADPSSCANTILAYCNSVNWNDPGCSSVGVTCPFRAGASSPCNLVVCTGTSAQLNENDCVSAIIDYCSSETRALRLNGGYSIDPACASFGQVSTVLLNTVATSFVNVSSQLPTLSNPANGQVSISGCAKLAPGTQSFLFASAVNATTDNRCMHYYFDAGTSPKRFQLHYGSTILTVSCSATFDDNNWHAVAAVVGASSVSFYVDNTLCGSVALPASRPSLCLSGDLLLGGRAPHNGPWDGLFTKVTYHEYALATSDISRLSSRCSGINEAVTTTRTVLYPNSTATPLYATTQVPLVGRRMSITGCMRQRTANRGFFFTNSESLDSDNRCIAVFSDGTLDQIWVTNGAVFAAVSNSGGLTFDDEVFHKLAVVINNQNVAVYRDGVLFGTATFATTTPPTTCPNGVSVIGARTPQLTFALSGLVDQVAFYNGALSAAEVAAVASATTCQEPPSDGSTALTSGVIDQFTYGTVPVPADTQFSISMCVNQYPNSAGTLFANSVSASSSSHCVAIHSDGQNNFLWLFWNGTKQVNLASGRQLDDGLTHKLTLVVTSTNFFYYLDGVMFNFGSLGGVPVTTCPQGVVTIGGRAPGVTSPAAATISNVVFFDYPMTSAQAATWASNTLCQETRTLLSTQLTSNSQFVSFVPPTIQSGVTSLQGCIRMAARTATYLFSNAVTSTSTDRRYALLLDGSNKRFRFFSDGIDVISANAAKTFDDGTWHAVAVVTDSTTAIFYLDGVYYGNVALPKAIVPMFNASNVIGDRQPIGSLRVNGAINYVRLHNFGLTPQQANWTCVERAAPTPTIVNVLPGSTTTAVQVDTTSLNVVDNYFISACLKMTAGSQTFLFSNSADNVNDNRCLSWFFSGQSTKSIRLFSGGNLFVSLSNSSIVFDNSATHRVFLSVQGRIVSFYVDGVLYGTTAFPVDIVPCLATGTTYIGGRAPNGLLPVSGQISDVRFGNYIDFSTATAACSAKSDDEEVLDLTTPKMFVKEEVTHESQSTSVVVSDNWVSNTVAGVCVVGAVVAVALFAYRRRRVESVV